MPSLLEDTLYRLHATLELDCKDYVALKGLLARQFDAAVAHDASAMEQVAAHITHSAERIESRRPQLLAILAELVGRRSTPSLRGLIERLPRSLPAPLREGLTSSRQQLQDLAHECQRMNLRNCELIHEQHALMQRLLGQTEGGYA